jgi:hypothetical protein
VVTVGETVMLLPVPAGVPPQEPENHCAVAPVPAVPPDKVKVVDAPAQIVVAVAEIPVGATEGVFTVTVTDAQVVVLQTLEYLTK